MARTREFDPDTALTGAMQVFAARGYSNTSIDDVVSATGVSRYGIYGTFGNKRELFEQALGRYIEQRGQAAFMRLLDPASGLAEIRETFLDRVRYVAEAKENNACLMINTAMSLGPRDSEIDEVLSKLFRSMVKAYEIALHHAQARGELREGVDPKETAEFLLGAFFGMVVMARVGFDADKLRVYVDSTIAGISAASDS